MTDRSHAPWCADIRGWFPSEAGRKWLRSRQPWRVLQPHPKMSIADIQKNGLCSPCLGRDREKGWYAPSETEALYLCAMPRTIGELTRCKLYWRFCCLKVVGRGVGRRRQSLAGGLQLYRLSARWKGQALRNAPAVSKVQAGRYLAFLHTSTRQYAWLYRFSLARTHQSSS